MIMLALAIFGGVVLIYLAGLGLVVVIEGVDRIRFEPRSNT